MKATVKALARRALAASMAIEPVRHQVRQFAQQGWVPRSVWKRLPVAGDFAVTLPGGAEFRYRSATGDAIGRSLYWRGVEDWEAETIAVFLRLAAASQHFLDIGANTGVYTLLACAISPTLQATAYEPVPRIYQRLADNIACNEFADRCTAKNMAVSNRRERVTLHVPYSALPTSASLSRDGFRGIAGELIEVESTTVDLDTAGGPPVDLVKIDVEGFEDSVLEGMTRVLAEDRPVILCECNPDGPYRAVEALSLQHGYTFFHVCARVPVRMARIEADATEQHRNYLLVPAERADAIATLLGAPVRASGRSPAQPTEQATEQAAARGCPVMGHGTPMSGQ